MVRRSPSPASAARTPVTTAPLRSPACPPRPSPTPTRPPAWATPAAARQSAAGSTKTGNTVTIVFHRRDAAATGSTAIDLVPSVDPAASGVILTQVDDDLGPYTLTSATCPCRRPPAAGSPGRAGCRCLASAASAAEGCRGRGSGTPRPPCRRCWPLMDSPMRCREGGKLTETQGRAGGPGGQVHRQRQNSRPAGACQPTRTALCFGRVFWPFGRTSFRVLRGAVSSFRTAFPEGRGIGRAARGPPAGARRRDIRPPSTRPCRHTRSRRGTW